MRPILYIIVDGMTETVAQGSSLSLATTPHMDLVASLGTVGFYEPVIGPSHAEPKTDVVVPALFGMPPTLNPGRAALELHDCGFPIVPGSYSCFIRVRQISVRAVADWTTAAVIDE